jgi:hypothetical protein
MHELDIVLPQDLEQDLVHLEQGKVAPNTQVAATAKLSR